MVDGEKEECQKCLAGKLSDRPEGRGPAEKKMKSLATTLSDLRGNLKSGGRKAKLGGCRGGETPGRGMQKKRGPAGEKRGIEEQGNRT